MHYAEITMTHKRNIAADCIPFCIERCGPQADDSLHIHEFHQLTIITRGAGVLVLNGISYPIRAGDIYVIGNFSAHYLKDMRSLEFINILFYLRDLEPHCQELKSLDSFQALFYLQPSLEPDARPSNLFSPAYREMEQIDRLVSQLLEEQQLAQAAAGLMIQSLFLQLIVTVCRAYQTSERHVTPLACRLREIVQYMEEHCTEPLHLAELARKSGLTERQLRHQFSQLYDCTPLQYLWNLRIRRACYYLASTDLPIAEIAELVGFEDNNYFSRRFRQALSMTPREYRNQSRPNDG